MPAQLFQQLSDFAVTPDIRFKFLEPEINSAFGKVTKAASLVPVPEAPMNQNYAMVPGQDNVRLAGYVISIQPKAVAHPVQH